MVAKGNGSITSTSAHQVPPRARKAAESETTSLSGHFSYQSYAPVVWEMQVLTHITMPQWYKTLPYPSASSKYINTSGSIPPSFVHLHQLVLRDSALPYSLASLVVQEYALCFCFSLVHQHLCWYKALPNTQGSASTHHNLFSATTICFSIHATSLVL